tara:strand:- start:1252 stop:4437 length:3186 start_codon:yes stop_codon:yes gene_type:complete
MMNRSVMQRQMFAKGGAAFPDLSGDGAVTQKDILMGRGVLPMQDGGMAMMPPPPGAAPMGPPPMPPGAAMAPPGAADQGPFDPAVLEGLLVDSAQSMEAMDAAAEEGDYATVINSIRGDELPLEARYEELAGVVGPEDSQQTPESVLTLLQPVMQMAAVDQGIGGLAQDQMTTPIEGPMAEGIMSTVNMEGAPPGPEQMAMAAPGGAAPVNFRQGGAVQYFNPENDNRVVQPDPLAGRLGEINKEKLALYQTIQGDQQAAFDEQQKMTKAQMLFDIARGALAFATPGETAMSPAERLAQVAQPVLGNIGARAGELQKFKQGQEQEQRALKLRALESAERTYDAEIAASDALALAGAKPRPTKMMNIVGPDGKLIASIDAANEPEKYNQVLKDNPTAKVYVPGSEKVANIKYVYTFDGNSYKMEPFDVNADLNGYNTALKADNAFNEKGAEPKLSAIKKIAELSVTGREQKWHRAKSDFSLGEGTSKRNVKKGEIIALDLLQANKFSAKNLIEPYDKDVSITEVYKFGEDPKILVSGPNFINDIKALGKGWSTTPPKFEQTVFSTVVNGKPVRETVNLSTPEGQKRALELNDMNYISDNPEVDAIIKAQVAERFDIRKEGRLLETTKAAEKRLLDKTINQEKREVLIAIAREGRAEEAAIKAENRANDKTLSAEERAEARKLAEEKRAELAQIRKENRDLKTQIEQEKRNLLTTIAEEKREEDRPYTKVINDILYRIDPSKPTGKQQTILIDGSTLPDVFGSSSLGKVMGLVTNESLLEKYAAGTLDPAVDGISDAVMEGALSVYTLPSETSFNEATKTQTTQPGRPLNSAQIKALQARKAAGLSVPNGVYFPADDIEAQMDKILNRKNGEAPGNAPLAEFLTNDAWGTPGFFKNLLNMGIEAVSFGYVESPWLDAKNADTAVRNLNQELEAFMLDAQDLRDSVYQGKKLADLTPDPSKFWQGESKSRSKALNLYLRLQRQVERIENALADEQVPMAATGARSVSINRQRLPVLRDLAAGYKLLAQIDSVTSGGEPEEVERTAREGQLIDALNEAINTPKTK